MNGYVDSVGRALIRVALRPTAIVEITEVEAWIDTGFTGGMVLSQDHIKAMALRQSAIVTAELADGTTTALNVHSCLIEWFGALIPVEVIASTSSDHLLGVELLAERVLTIDYSSRTVTID